MDNSEDQRFIDLLQAITKGKSKPSDEWELTALLETNGLRDVDVKTDWAEPDLFSLAQKLMAYVDVLTYEIKEKKFEKYRLRRIAKNYIKGAIFAFPMFIQLVAMIVIGFGIWSSINFGLREATAIAVGTLFALFTTGGVAQMIGRKGLFYIKFEEFLLASKITKRLYLAGVVFILACALLFTLINVYFNILPLYLFQLFIIYYLLLSFLFLIFSVFYMLENYGTIALIILSGIIFVYIFLIFLDFETVKSQVISLIIIVLIANVIAFLKLRKLSKKSQAVGTLLPNIPSLFYSLYPYLLYGSAYFLFLIMDRMLAWTTGKTVLPYIVWFNYPYEVGMDWALIPLMSTIALIEVFIYELGFFAFKRINLTPAPKVKEFNKYFLSTYKLAAVTFFVVGLLSVLFAYAFPYAIKDIKPLFQFIDVFFNEINLFVFTFGSIGYVLLSWSLLNCLVFSFNAAFMRLHSLSIVSGTGFFFLFRDVTCVWSAGIMPKASSLQYCKLLSISKMSMPGAERFLIISKRLSIIALFIRIIHQINLISLFCGIDNHGKVSYYKNIAMDNKQIKRSEKRKPCEQEVTFELSADKAVNFNKTQFNGQCVDISKYGMGLTTEHQLERSQVIRLHLPMKHIETNIPVFAEVVWSKPDDGMSRTGLRFLI